MSSGGNELKFLISRSYYPTQTIFSQTSEPIVTATPSTGTIATTASTPLTQADVTQTTMATTDRPLPPTPASASITPTPSQTSLVNNVEGAGTPAMSGSVTPTAAVSSCKYSLDNMKTLFNPISISPSL